MRKYIFISTLLLASLACNLSTDVAPTPDIGLMRTQVAIELTQTAIAQPTLPAPAVSTKAPATQVSPTNTVAPTVAATKAATTVANGSISGSLGYPASGIPPLEVYAISKDDPKKFFFVKTVLNQTTFIIKDVTPGVYVVVAYSLDYKISGGWTKAVPCGLTAACKDNTLIPVTVKSGEDTKGVEVKDWYAPAGTFPPRPN